MRKALRGSGLWVKQILDVGCWELVWRKLGDWVAKIVLGFSINFTLGLGYLANFQRIDSLDTFNNFKVVVSGNNLR